MSTVDLGGDSILEQFSSEYSIYIREMGSCGSKPVQGQEDVRVAGPDTGQLPPQPSVEHVVEDTTPWTIAEACGGLSSERGRWKGDATLLERFEKVMGLAQSALNCQLADILLMEEERYRLESVVSKARAPVREELDPRRLLPVDKEYIVMDDLKESAEYSDHPCVVGEPHVRYFVGIWLVSSENPDRRHGMLFLADTRPRSGASTGDVVNLMRELRDLLVGEIQKYELEIMERMIRERRNLDMQGSGRRFGSHMSRHVSSVSSRGSEESVGSLCAAADCFHGGVMVLESVLTVTYEAHWNVLYLNEELMRSLHVNDSSTLVNKDIWESFSVNSEDRSDAYRCMKDHVAFEMSLTLQNKYHPTAETFVFQFRPASVESAKKASSRPDGIDKYYFAIMKTPGEARFDLPGSQRRLPLSLSRDAPTVFKDIRLGPMIGRGAYGRVYRGNWNGNIVAVKVITSDSRRRSHEDAQLPSLQTEDVSIKSLGMHEAAISTALSHPNVVHTYQYSVRHVETPQKGSLERKSIDGSFLPQSPMTEIWLISEFCNRGPLLTAIENGQFLIKSNDQHAQPNLIFILQTLQEISAAMEYLHSHDIVHGDLTGGNVLLTSSDKDGRGFTAKVVDFGLSRVCEGGALKTSKMGCAEYMPPELITGGLLTKSGDVYAFGVILWELYNGKRAWNGLKPVEVLEKVARHEVLTFGEHTPRRLKILGEKCMSTHPKQRPIFSDIVFEVNSILSDTMCILQKFLGATNINPQHP